MNFKISAVGFWVAAIVPFGICFVFLYVRNETAFAFLFIAYCMLYRPLLAYQRLYGKGLVRRQDWWRFLIPGLGRGYFKELWIG